MDKELKGTYMFTHAPQAGEIKSSGVRQSKISFPWDKGLIKPVPYPDWEISLLPCKAEMEDLYQAVRPPLGQ